MTNKKNGLISMANSYKIITDKITQKNSGCGTGEVF